MWIEQARSILDEKYGARDFDRTINNGGQLAPQINFYHDLDVSEFEEYVINEGPSKSYALKV